MTTERIYPAASSKGELVMHSRTYGSHVIIESVPLNPNFLQEYIDIIDTAIHNLLVVNIQNAIKYRHTNNTSGYTTTSINLTSILNTTMRLEIRPYVVGIKISTSALLNAINTVMLTNAPTGPIAMDQIINLVIDVFKAQSIDDIPQFNTDLSDTDRYPNTDTQLVDRLTLNCHMCGKHPIVSICLDSVGHFVFSVDCCDYRSSDRNLSHLIDKWNKCVSNMYTAEVVQLEFDMIKSKSRQIMSEYLPIVGDILTHMHHQDIGCFAWVLLIGDDNKPKLINDETDIYVAISEDLSNVFTKLVTEIRKLGYVNIILCSNGEGYIELNATNLSHIPNSSISVAFEYSTPTLKVKE